MLIPNNRGDALPYGAERECRGLYALCFFSFVLTSLVALAVGHVNWRVHVRDETAGFRWRPEHVLTAAGVGLLLLLLLAVV
jgi:hypothetical protein